MAKITIGTAIGSNVAGNVSGGVLIAGHVVQKDGTAIEALIAQFKKDCEIVAQALPAEPATDLRAAAATIETELASGKPDIGRVRSLMDRVLAQAQSLTGFADSAVNLAKNIAEILSKLSG
jgi:hypothetical protein